MDTVIVIMLKNSSTGFLEKELSSITVEKNDEFILNLFAIEENGGTYLHIRVTTDKETKDWEYNAILDFYDTDVFKSVAVSASEMEESCDPSWEIIVEYTDDTDKLTECVSNILAVHRKELYEVYEIIADKESEYSE